MGDVDDERLGVAVGVHDPVPARAGDAGDGGAEAHLIAEGVGERLEVLLGPVPARRTGGSVRLDPAGGGQQLLGGRVDDLAPGGEQPHVRPLAHRRCGDRAGLQDQRGEAAVDQVGGGSESGGTGPDHDDGQLGGGRRVHGRLLGVSTFIDDLYGQGGT